MAYTDLINIDEFTKRESFIVERWDVSFYCKDCRRIVETDRKTPNGYIFICKECSGNNIALWTLEWLKSNYKIKN